MSNFKRSQAKHVKQTHKITNWAAYDQALVNRGSLTFWFTNEAISKWTAPASGRVEARVGCQILNRMTSLGMPESHRVD